MRSINCNDEIIEIKDKDGALYIYRSLESITFLLNNNDKTNEYIISKEDYLLFCEFRKLFNRIHGSKLEERFMPKKIKIGNGVEIEGSVEHDGICNSFELLKIDEDTFKLRFNFKARGSQSVEIKCDSINFQNYAPYDMAFMDFFNNVYSADKECYQMNLEECEYIMRKKLN